VECSAAAGDPRPKTPDPGRRELHPTGFDEPPNLWVANPRDKEQIPMPLKVSVGFSKKIGLPNYSSLGASCEMECELDGSLLQGDLDQLQTNLQHIYAASARAVEEQLARYQASAAVPEEPQNGRPSNARPAAKRPCGRAAGPTMRMATPAQVHAIRAMAEQRSIDLKEVLQELFEVEKIEELSLSEASQLIHQMRHSGP
jgi:hypothetical protein